MIIRWQIHGTPLVYAPVPQIGPNSFIFLYVFVKKHLHHRLPPPNGPVPPQQEILDPPLPLTVFHSVGHKYT